MDLTSLRESFLSEFEDHIQRLNNNLVILEKDPQNQNVLHELMRSSHTIKGSSATMGYRKTALLTHVLEDVFDLCRNKRIQLTIQIINILFIALDTLERSYRSIQTTGNEIDLDPISNKIQEITKLLVDKGGNSDSAAPISGVGTPALSHNENEAISHIKVPVARLDNLMNLTEELFIEKMKLQALSGSNTHLDPIIVHLSRLISDIQFQVMQTRLVPLEQIFTRFPRMVRDTASRVHKNVELIITGNDMEVDRSVIDRLSEPLTHLIRNAIDHGISHTGHIFLSAKRERQNIHISVADDGNGIDWTKVLDVARNKGVITSEQFNSFLTLIQDPLAIPNEIVKLIYDPRITTNDTVTELSGRGVGLNVVEIFAKQLGGRVIYEHIPTGGTCFSLELPATLTIIQCLMVRVEDQIFAIPFTIIDHSLDMKSSDIKKIADEEAVVVDGVDVPLIRLETLFRLGPKKSKEEKKSDKKENDTFDKMFIVLIRRNDEVAGIVVDELIKQQDVVIKSMPSILQGIQGFSGTTFLEDGKTILVLDSHSLLETTRE